MLSQTVTLPSFGEVSGPLPYSMTNDLLVKLLLERTQPLLKSLLASLLYLPESAIYY